jgi:hypothetical protein
LALSRDPCCDFELVDGTSKLSDADREAIAVYLKLVLALAEKRY